MTRNALVCGAGISGLATAIGLTKRGWTVTVFEREDQLRTAGAGLNLWPNGVRVLDALGVGERYRQICKILARYCTYDSDGTLIATEDVSHWQDRFGAPLTGVYRSDLSEMLADAVGGDRIRFGCRLTGFDDDGARVHAFFADGTQAAGDLLVGADGVHSATRAALFGEHELQDDGLVRWRGMFDLAASGVDQDAEVEVLNSDAHLGYLPIGGSRAYWFAAVRGIEQNQEAVYDYFAGWRDSLVTKVIHATYRDTIISNVLEDFVTPLASWARGRVALVGDAAHPMLPGLAQGANQALQDARVLAQVLDENAVEAGLQAYEVRRLPQVAPIVANSRSLFDFSGQHATYRHRSTNEIFRNYMQFAEAAS